MQNKKSFLFDLLIVLTTTEVLFSILYNQLGFHPFQMIPYLRLFVIFFFALFLFYRKLISLNKLTKINLKINSENMLVLSWLIYTIIELMVGLIKWNPKLYVFTDTFYIFCGYVIYRVFASSPDLQNEILTQPSNAQEKSYVYRILLLSLISLPFNVFFPPFVLVFNLGFSLLLFNQKKYVLSILLSAPFFFQILSSNRSILIVFIIVIFIALTQNKFTRKDLNKFFIYLSCFFVLCYFFLDDLLGLIIEILPVGTDLRFRLFQIFSILRGHFDWNSPSFLSLKQRIDEMNLVLNYWLSNPLNFIFGGGMGATLEGFSFKDTSVTETTILGKAFIHNIHILPFSLIFRYGLFGLTLFIHLVYNLFKYLIKIILSENSLLKTIYIFQFCWIMYTIPAASFLWTSPFFWITLSYLSNESKKL